MSIWQFRHLELQNPLVISDFRQIQDGTTIQELLPATFLEQEQQEQQDGILSVIEAQRN